jgi:hypothetical protein
MGLGLDGVSGAKLLIPGELRPKSCGIRGYGFLSGVKCDRPGVGAGPVLWINLLVLFYRID